MCLLISMVLMGAINLVICDPADPYTKDCEPPHGFPINSTSIDPDYIALRPIERCCPYCHECKKIGGNCKISWLPVMYPEWCDFTTLKECRDYSCSCCIKCADDKCSPCSETGGECRVECRPDEIEDLYNNCHFTANGNNRTEGCKCCKRCEATSECSLALGKCVTHPDDCHHGSFASTGCCGGCYCCKPVLQPVFGSNCADNGGYCSETDDCANGYYACFGECSKTLNTAGLKSVVLGYCCIPKQKP